MFVLDDGLAGSFSVNPNVWDTQNLTLTLLVEDESVVVEGVLET